MNDKFQIYLSKSKPIKVKKFVKEAGTNQKWFDFLHPRNYIFFVISHAIDGIFMQGS